MKNAPSPKGHLNRERFGMESRKSNPGVLEKKAVKAIVKDELLKNGSEHMKIK